MVLLAWWGGMAKLSCCVLLVVLLLTQADDEKVGIGGGGRATSQTALLAIGTINEGRGRRAEGDEGDVDAVGNGRVDEVGPMEESLPRPQLPSG